MRQKISLILSFCLLVAATSFAQQKKPVTKPRPKTTTKPKAPATRQMPVAVTPPKPAPCFPLKEVREYYKIDVKDKLFKDEYEEIFELSPYDYSGYALKTIIENTIRMRLGDAAANNLDMFAGASYVEIAFMKPDSKAQIVDEICKLFADPLAFEKYIKTLKKKSREEGSNWRK